MCLIAGNCGHEFYFLLQCLLVFTILCIDCALSTCYDANLCKYYVSGHFPCPVYSSKHVSDTGFFLRLQVKCTQLGPVDGASPYLREGGRDRILSPKRYVSKNKQDAVLRPLSQTFRFYLAICVMT
jgi:hypothetical protein